MNESQLKIGVLSRRAPIGQAADLETELEHVGGLTRVLPALAEFAEIAWTSFNTQSQIDSPMQYSFSKLSGQDYQNDIQILLTDVDHSALQQSDWFLTNYVWPLLHDLPVPEIEDVDLSDSFESIKSICQSLASNCVNVDNAGYLVNDFQLSQVPAALKKLEPQKPISFFLHTPWPKAELISNFAVKILKSLATGMLGADVLEFQTQSDLAAFERFALGYLPAAIIGTKLKVNPVSVNVLQLQQHSWSNEPRINLEVDDISYVHIARSDPIKNTLLTIKSFTAFVEQVNDSTTQRYLDLFIVPSRQQWPEYQDLLADIEGCVETCNSQIGTANYLPIRLHMGDDYNLASQALMRYDYLIACSVADGLNLVVKEGAILNNRNGVIISTPRVGAMAELGKICVMADATSEEGMVKALITASELDLQTRQAMSEKLKKQITEFDASHWAETVIASLKILEKV